MDGCLWKFRRYWRITPRALSRRRSSYLRARIVLTCLSKFPEPSEGLPAIEEAIFAGIPVNVTLLFSPEQYRAVAEAYTRGVERRIDAGLNRKVGSVASVFVSRWDTAVAGKVPPELTNRLGIAIARRTYEEVRRTARLIQVAACL